MDDVRYSIQLCEFAREVGRACARDQATKADMRRFDEGWDYMTKRSNYGVQYYADAFTRGYMLETALQKHSAPKVLTFLGGRVTLRLSDEKASVTLRMRKTAH